MTADSFRRSRAIVRAAVSTLRREPRLLWFPVIAFVAHAVFAGSCAALLLARGRMGRTAAVDIGIPGGWLFAPQVEIDVQTGSLAGLMAWVGFQLVTVACAVALTHAALEALAGRPWNVGAAFRRVAERRSAIAGYAVVRATAGMLLRSRRSRRRHRRHRGESLRKLGRLAWSAVTYLAIPVLTREDRGALESIRRSASLLSATWREGVLGRFTLGWLWIPIVMGGFVPLVGGAFLGVEDDATWLLAVLLSASFVGLGGVVIAALDGIYRAALYVFATEGVVPEPFSDPDLDTLWETSGDGDGSGFTG